MEIQNNTTENGQISFDEYLKLKQEFEHKQKDIEQRLWLDATISQFDNLLRLNYSKTTEDFAKIILQELAEITNAFIGVFYVYNKDTQLIHATATYACKIEKLTQSVYQIGEGAIGQAAESKKVIYFDDLPQKSLDFTVVSVKVSAASIFILPLVFNNEVYGVLEFMHLKPLEERYLQLLETIAKNIASMLESIFNNALTKKLLHEAQHQNETLQAQEEEIRQNMEEMQTAQEELHRRQAQLDSQLFALDDSKIMRAEFSPDGYLKDANAIFYGTVGYEANELLGKHHQMLIPAEQHNAPEYKQFWENLRAGLKQSGEFVRIGKNGRVITLSATYCPIFDKNDKVERILKCALDISPMQVILKNSQEQNEKMQAQEEELRQNMEEMQSMQESLQRQFDQTSALKRDLDARMNVFDLATILSEADLKGNILYVNKKLIDVTQYAEKELIGQPHNMLRHPDMPKAVFKVFWDTIQAGKVFRGIVKNRKKDGSHYWVDAVISPVLGENGKPVKYIGVRYLIEDEALAEKLFAKMCKDLGI